MCVYGMCLTPDWQGRQSVKEGLCDGDFWKEGMDFCLEVHMREKLHQKHKD